MINYLLWFVGLPKACLTNMGSRLQVHYDVLAKLPLSRVSFKVECVYTLIFLVAKRVLESFRPPR